VKIRKRITLASTALASGILLILSLAYFYFSMVSQKEIFESRLAERLEISEKFFLENPENNAELKSKFLQTLPLEKELLIPLDDLSSPGSVKSLKNLPKGIIQLSSFTDYYFWEKNGATGISKTYDINGSDFLVAVVAQDVYGKAFLNKLAKALLVFFLVFTALAFGFSKAFSKRILKPVNEKIKKANSISAQNLSQRLKVHNREDELGMLAVSFNGMLDRIQTSYDLQKDFVKFASHELKNPLAAVLGQTELALSKERSVAEYKAYLTQVAEQAERLNLILTKFLNLSALDSQRENFIVLRLDEILMEAALEVNQLYPKKNIKLDFNAENPEALLAQAEPQLIKIALMNLIDNACKYSDNDVVISISKESENIKISVSDKGIGITEEEQLRVFDLMYRSENSRAISGSGIGLNLVKKIVDIHQWSVSVNSTLGIGSVFQIILPAHID